MNRKNITLAVALCSAIGMYFVSNGNKPSEGTIPPVAPAAQAADSPAPAAATPVVAVVKEAKTTSDAPPLAEKPTIPKIAFQPPSPDRVNLFSAPERQNPGKLISTDRSQTKVELLGFVNVNGQRVSLSIDGIVATIAEGEEQYGIKVTKIQNPTVYLKSGLENWRATLDY